MKKPCRNSKLLSFRILMKISKIAITTVITFSLAIILIILFKLDLLYFLSPTIRTENYIFAWHIFYPLILISFISSFLNLLKNIIYKGRFDTLLEILSLLPFITVLAFCLYLIFIFQ